MMFHDLSSPPPSYDELYPGTGGCDQCDHDAEAGLIGERLCGVRIPQRYVDLMTRDPPPHATYFSRTQFRSVIAFLVGVKRIIYVMFQIWGFWSVLGRA